MSTSISNDWLDIDCAICRGEDGRTIDITSISNEETLRKCQCNRYKTFHYKECPICQEREFDWKTDLEPEDKDVDIVFWTCDKCRTPVFVGRRCELLIREYNMFNPRDPKVVER